MKKNLHPLQPVWQNMKARCLNERDPAYRNYGGRGISVCSRWTESARVPGSRRSAGFQNFLDDMGPRPEGSTLDRVDNTLGYSPENCEWRTRAQQVRNRRSYGEVDLKWVSLNKGKWGKPYISRFRHPESREIVSCGWYDTATAAHLAACATRLETYWRIR